MKKSVHTSFAVLGLAAATTAFAQSDATASASSSASASAGLLGKRYVEAQAFLIDYQNFEDNGFGVGAAVNVPVTANVDVGAWFQHNWTEGDQGDNFQDLALYVTGYCEHGDLRPFATASIAYEWWSVSDDFWYQLDVGAEYTISDQLSVSARVGWFDYFSSDWDNGAFLVSTRANYWVTPTIATSLTVGYVEGGTWNYGVAAVFTF